MAGASATYDVAVLGAGAAGLVAAFRAAERGRGVVLLEKNRRVGVKILMSGGTRCNITNARGLRDLSCVSGPVDPAYNPRESRGLRSIQNGFGPNGAFLGPALRSLTVEATIRLFEAEGVATKVEAGGKIFPVSDSAIDVQEALLRRLGRSGAELRPSTAVRAVKREGDGFVVETEAGDFTASRVVVAVGGRSYPGSGTSGDGYEIARSLGHTLVEPRPALVPLRVAAGWVAELRGITVPDVKAAIVDRDGNRIDERREAVLFAHFGLTGPAILDVSGAVARGDRPEDLELRLDWLPEEPAESVDTWIREECRRGRPLVAAVVGRKLPRRLADALLQLQSIPADRVGPELSREERRRLVLALKELRLPLAGTLGFAKAEVTSGGVSLSEINPATMESLLVTGLYFVGEVLDLDGRIGGYNFQAAWSTGWLAGESV